MRIRFGFPLEERIGDKDGLSRKHDGGVALLIAIFAVSIIMVFATNMIVNSAVQREMSLAKRDRAKAEYLAKSGLNFALFLIGIDWGIDLLMFSGKLGAPPTPVTDTAGDPWGMMNGLPIGGDTLEMMGQMKEQFKLNAVLDDDVMSVLGDFDGSFTVNVTDESSKINLNNCSNGLCTGTIKMLTALMGCPAEKKYLADKNLVASELALRIKDWVDTNKSGENTGLSGEDDPYEARTPPDKSKNAPMDVVSEVKMIEGFDDDLYTIFSPYFTVYPFPLDVQDSTKMNLNTLPREMLHCLFPDAATRCQQGFYKSMVSRDEDSSALASDQQAVATFLADKLCQASTTPTTPENPQPTPSSSAPPPAGTAPQGMTDDPKTWFTTFSRVFRVEVDGVVGGHERKLVVVLERRVADKKKGEQGFFSFLYHHLD